MQRAIFASSLDAYSKRARVTPALLVVFPLLLSYAAWEPRALLGWGALLALAAGSGLLLLVTELVREAGQAAQERLFSVWGGNPTATLLRHRDTRFDATKTRRCHEALTAILGVKLPSPAEELSAPTAADEAYAHCVDRLRERTRDKERFALVHEENASYGFRRNLYALRSWGIITSAAGCLSASLRAILVARNQHAADVFAIGCAIVAGVLLLWWCVRVTPSFVWRSANQYGERLLTACEMLYD